MKHITITFCWVAATTALAVPAAMHLAQNIKPTQYLPTVLIVIDIAAAIPYAATGDWRKSLYWLFAAGLTATVTY